MLLVEIVADMSVSGSAQRWLYLAVLGGSAEHQALLAMHGLGLSGT